MLVSLCGYFLLLLATRSYPEWNAWRLRHQAPVAAIVTFSKKQQALLTALAKERDSHFDAFMKVIAQLGEAYEEPQHLSQLRDQTERASRDFSTANADLKVFSPLTIETFENPEYNSLSARRDRLFDALIKLNDRYYAEREAWEQKREPEIEALVRERRRLEGKMETIDRKVTLIANQETYLSQALSTATNLLPIRAWFETILPLLFGASAIVLAVARHN